MAGDNFDKGWVYVLHFQIPGQTSNYFKIGLTKNPIPNRISGLQTGNPFKIVKQHHFDSECMGLLEGHLHKVFAERRFRKEWFTFTPSQLKKLIQEGTTFSNQYNPLAINLRKLDRQTSIHKAKKPTSDHLKLHKQAIKISRKIQEIELQMEIAKENLRRLTGNCIGIDGVAGFTAVKVPAASFKPSELKKHDLKEWMLWQRTDVFSKKEGIVGEGTKLQNHSKLDAEHKALRTSAGALFDLTTYNSKTKSRSKSSRDYHEKYIDCIGKLGFLKADLDMIIIQFKIECKRREGIDGVFKYIRTDNGTKFDKDSFLKNKNRKAHDSRWFFSKDPSPSFSVENAISYQ